MVPLITAVPGLDGKASADGALPYRPVLAARLGAFCPVVDGASGGACGLEIEDQDAVGVGIGVVKADGLGDVDAKFMHQPVSAYAARPTAAAAPDGIRVAGVEAGGFQPDAVAGRVIKQDECRRRPEPLVRHAAHGDLALRVHRHVNCRPLRTDVAPRALLPIFHHMLVAAPPIHFKCSIYGYALHR